MCSVCKTKPATVFFTNVRLGEDKTVNTEFVRRLRQGQGHQRSDELRDGGLDARPGRGTGNRTAAGAELKCPRCGFSQADFKKSGRLGLSGMLPHLCRGTGRLAQDDAQRHAPRWQVARGLAPDARKCGSAENAPEETRQGDWRGRLRNGGGVAR